MSKMPFVNWMPEKSQLKRESRLMKLNYELFDKREFSFVVVVVGSRGAGDQI